MKYRVRHHTRYDYQEPVLLSHNVGHLGLRETARQSVSRWEVVVTPEPSVISHHKDWLGNHTSIFTVEQPHSTLEVLSLAEVEVTAPAVDLAASEPWEATRVALAERPHEDAILAAELSFDSPAITAPLELARSYARASFPPGRPVLAAALDLTKRIHADFRYQPGTTTVTTPVSEALRERRGVCQDFAHVEIALLRSIGLAARYVSGYLRSIPPPGQERLLGSEESHAWVSVWSAKLGWVDFDPTGGRTVTDQHVTVAWGRDYQDVPPLKGIVLGGGSGHTLKVAVEVRAKEG